MDVRAGFRLTDVGIIPEDWTVQSLNTIAKVTSGKRLPLGYFVADRETPYPYIRVTDMRPGRVDTGDIKYVPEAAYSSISKYRIFKDDLYISVAGTLGIVGAIPEELDGANLTENADRISAIACDKNYLLHVMLSPVVQSVIGAEQTAGAQPKLALFRIRNFAIPLPPTREEQCAIATALSDVDALLDALERLIAKKRGLKQAAMQQLLTGQTRLPGFEGEWTRFEMERHASLKARIGWQGLTTGEYLQDGPFTLVTGTDFSQGRVTWDSCWRVGARRYEQDPNIQLRPNDVLLTKDGSIGKVAFVDVLPAPATLNSGVFVVRPKEGWCEPRFLFYVLSSRIFEEFLTRLQAGSTITHLYQKDFVGFSFPAPASRDEQEAISSALADMDADLVVLEHRLEKTRALKQGMMQELLTGRTRLVAPEEATA